MSDSSEEIQQEQTNEVKSEKIKNDQKEPLSSAEEKKAKIERSQKIMTKLVELFPSAITQNNDEVKPLMIGVVEAIMEKSEKCFDIKDLRRTIAYYCSAKSYLKATIEQTHRVDLEGNPVQEISEAHKEVAAKKLEGNKQKSEKTNRQKAHELKQKADMEAAAARRAAKAEKAALEAAEKLAKEASIEKEVKPKKVESKPATVVVKAKKSESITPTVIVKTKKTELPSTPASSVAESESGEPVRKKLSLKSKA